MKLWAFILAFLAASASPLPLPFEKGASRDLYVLTLLPYFVPEFSDELQYLFDLGNTLYPALQIAAEIINNRSDVLQDYNIRLITENSACLVPFRAREGLMRGLSLGKDNFPVVGVIGPACSISSTAVAEICSREEVSLLNLYFAGTPDINREKYPFSYGSIDSVDVIANTLIALIQRQSWRNVSVLYAESRLYYSSLAQLLNKAVLKYNERVEHKVELSQSGVRDNQPTTVTDVQNENRIVVFMADGKLLLEMLCLLDDRGIRFPNYMFIMAGAFFVQAESVEVMVKSRLVSCTKTRIQGILNTSVLIDYQLESTDKDGIKFSGISLNTFKKMYEERVEEFNQENGSDLPMVLDAAIFYDSLWSLSLALNNSMDRVNLSTYSYLGQQENTNVIRSELEKLDFEGLSGRVRYNSSTGRVKQNVSITLFSGKKLGYYTSSSNQITTIAEDFNDSFINDQFFNNIVFIPDYLLYIVVFFAVISLAVIVSLHVATFVYRKRNSVKASSVRLSQVAYASCYTFIVIILLNVIIQGGFLGMIEPSTTCVLQHVLDFLFSLSLTLLFGSTCLRTWRLYRIFVHFSDPGKFLSDSYLLVAMGILLVINTVFTIPPVFINRYSINCIDVTAPDNTDPELIIIAVCQRSNYFVWFFFDLLVTIVLMVILLFLTVRTRNIAQKNFKTRLTIWMLYLLTLLLPVMVSVYLVFSVGQTYYHIIIRFVIFSLLMEGLIVVTIILVFLPPLLPIIMTVGVCMRLRGATLRRPSFVSSRSIRF